MKIGDLVMNGQGHTGIVTAIRYAAAFKAYEDSLSLNPDIHVVTASGKRIWSYNALESISETRWLRIRPKINHKYHT